VQCNRSRSRSDRGMVLDRNPNQANRRTTIAARDVGRDKSYSLLSPVLRCCPVDFPLGMGSAGATQTIITDKSIPGIRCVVLFAGGSARQHFRQAYTLIAKHLRHLVVDEPDCCASSVGAVVVGYAAVAGDGKGSY
jgi:hypothetical protein